MWVLAPHSSQTFLTKKYGKVFKCKTWYWNHRKEKQEIPMTFDCSELNKFYPLVEREHQHGQVVEQLTLNRKVIQQFVVPGEEYII